MEVQTYGESLHLLVDSAKERLPELKKALDKHDITYRGIRRTPARMEEAFISLIRQMDESWEKPEED